jgi:hypothetical protein
MEHRWGQRIDVAIPVRLRASAPVGENTAQLANLSLSGGWIAATVDVRRFSTIQVIFELPEPLSGPHSINAYVARQTPAGIGLEWCEHSPKLVVQLFHTLARGHYGGIIAPWASAPTPRGQLDNLDPPRLHRVTHTPMENRMHNASRHESQQKTSPLIEKLQRQMEAAGRDTVPASVYQAQDAHWSANYATRPYVGPGEDYEDYAPAYLYGVFLYHSNPDLTFDEYEGDLANGWESARSDSPLDWSRAKPAVREAWYRISDLAKRAKSERAELLSTSPEATTPGDH